MGQRHFFVGVLIIAASAVAHAKPLSELKFEMAKIDPDHVDCSKHMEVIDECGLQQGFSYRITDFAYPTNHSALASSCKRQMDALKCLRAYSKCLQPLPKQIMIAMVGSRQRYTKKVCSEKPSEASEKFLELNKCMESNRDEFGKGIAAELNAIVLPESITKNKIATSQERLKQSCCAVARMRREFMDTTLPHCKQHAQVASELIDSYLMDTVGIICPDMDNSGSGKLLKGDCDKLPKLTISKTPNSRFFVKPIMGVVQVLV